MIHWMTISPFQAIQEADQLYRQGKFQTALKLLNRPTFNRFADVQWRIGRLLYKISNANGVTKKVKQGMIEEAEFVLNKSFRTGVCNTTA